MEIKNINNKLCCEPCCSEKQCCSDKKIKAVLAQNEAALPEQLQNDVFQKSIK